MNTIPSIIENRLEKGISRTEFTFLSDGENNKQVNSLNEIRRDALEIFPLLRKDTATLICLPQGISFIKAFIGCLYARSAAVPVAVPTRQRGIENLQNIVQDSGISFIITNRQTFENLQKWFGADVFSAHIEWLLIEDIEAAESAPSTVFELPNPARTALLQYTSGSTGKPKAVVVTHENIIANSRFIQKSFQNNSDSISVCWLPSFHDMGLIDGIIQPIFSNFQAVLLPPVHFLQKPIRWFKALTEYRATYSGAPNFAFDFCCNRIKNEELERIDLSRLRCLYNGSEPIRAKTVRRFVERFSSVGFTLEKMFACYGLAETTLAVTTARLGEKPTILKLDEKSFRQNKIEQTENKPAVELVGCGFADENCILKIVNPATLEECAEMEIGEIWTAGKSLADGYYNDVDLSRETFIFREDNRYLRTGDLGFLAKGELFVTGRIKDLIIIRGKNHYPHDIEQIVSRSHDALQINGCAAFSVEIEGEEKLVVVQEVKRTWLKKIDYKAIFEAIMSEISLRHGVTPHDVALIAPATLPKTTSGKIRRPVCRQLWIAGNLQSLTQS